MRISRRVVLLIVSPCLFLIAAAWIQWGVAGLPYVASIPHPIAQSAFPAWLRIAHYVNFLFLSLLIRSGLQILMDHPRLYSNMHCTPGSEWLRLTPVEVPRDRVWTSKDDSRHLSPFIGLPGRRHTVGMARHWHFLSVFFWVGNGIVFVVLLFASGLWRLLAPTSWQIVPEAWAVLVHYATLHLPPAEGAGQYNALQQLTYFGVVFVLAPLAIVTGPSMSPALTNRFRSYPFLPGNRQVGRSLHFLTMAAFTLFTIGHVILVAITGLMRNMNHIARGTDDANPAGLYLGLAGIVVIIGVNAWANWSAWRHPRAVQHAARRVVTPVMRLALDRARPVAEFGTEDISPFFWVNGKLPTRDQWHALAANDFQDYRLKVFGLVDNPAEFSLQDIQALGRETQITQHHCIQGWSGVAQWGGVPLAQLMNAVRPKAAARAVVFYSFGDGVDFNSGVAKGQYYDSLSIENAAKPHTLLAYEMNFAPLGRLHGAPLRLRVENQLGFKMVKWIEAIEFVADVGTVNKGEGGYAEDNEYFGELANI